MYSYTSDNGSNFICLGKKLQSQQGSLLLCDDLQDLKEELELEKLEEMESEEMEDAIDGDDDFEYNDESYEDPLHMKLFCIMSVIRCAAHSIQLAVFDAIKSLGIQKKIKEIRMIVKALKSSKFNEIYDDLKMTKPRLNVVTRWNSLYLMFESLLKEKTHFVDFYKKVKESNVAEFTLSENNWNFMEKFCQAFKAPFVCTKKLQAEQLNMGLFFYNLYHLN